MKSSKMPVPQRRLASRPASTFPARNLTGLDETSLERLVIRRQLEKVGRITKEQSDTEELSGVGYYQYGFARCLPCVTRRPTC